jgi:hypothetical protein
MDKETDPAVAKLKRIEQLWRELQREIPDSPAYKSIAEQIRVLSAEYQGLARPPKKPLKSD